MLLLCSPHSSSSSSSTWNDSSSLSHSLISHPCSTAFQCFDDCSRRVCTTAQVNSWTAAPAVNYCWLKNEMATTKQMSQPRRRGGLYEVNYIVVPLHGGTHTVWRWWQWKMITRPSSCSVVVGSTTGSFSIAENKVVRIWIMGIVGVINRSIGWPFLLATPAIHSCKQLQSECNFIVFRA